MFAINSGGKPDPDLFSEGLVLFAASCLLCSDDHRSEVAEVDVFDSG
tara:strand:- start:1172 stop:1312 length:141 start_codon:yes stop_codon:yes gene_type:complete